MLLNIHQSTVKPSVVRKLISFEPTNIRDSIGHSSDNFGNGCSRNSESIRGFSIKTFVANIIQE